MKKITTTHIIVAFVVVQAVASIVLAFFLFNLVTDPSSQLNKSIANQVQQVAQSFKPIPGLQGEKGEQGETGAQGPTGLTGPKGDKGDLGSQGADGTSIKGEKGEKGDTGETGATGAQGPAGPRAEFRCNPETAKQEYKYPDDEDWTETGGACLPLGGNHE